MKALVSLPAESAVCKQNASATLETQESESVPYRPEYANLLRLAAAASGAPLEQRVPQVCEQIERIADVEAGDLAAYLVRSHGCKMSCLRSFPPYSLGCSNPAKADDGTPVVVSDAAAAWPALQCWSPDWLGRRCGGALLLLNDRAPARRADALAGPGSRQRTVWMPLAAYAAYIQARRCFALRVGRARHGAADLERAQQSLPGSLEGALAAAGGDAAAARAPFYANGWPAFCDVPALAADCPPPPAFAAVDDTRALLGAVERALVAAQAPSQPWSAMADRLTKVFMGPAGTITRLHYDAASAHGWLAQVSGRKLFVLYRPADSACLYPLAAPDGTQSAIDPLDAEAAMRFPLYAGARPRSVVLGPGEALLMPAGWWHYAGALDPSITVMRNFYHKSNAAGLVDLVLSTARGLSTTRLPGKDEGVVLG